MWIMTGARFELWLVDSGEILMEFPRPLLTIRVMIHSSVFRKLQVVSGNTFSRRRCCGTRGGRGFVGSTGVTEMEGGMRGCAVFWGGRLSMICKQLECGDNRRNWINHAKVGGHVMLYR